MGIIASVPGRTSSDPSYDEFDILKIKKLYMYTVGFCMYTYINDMLPELFKVMFVNFTHVHDHDTRITTTNQLYIPIYGTVRPIGSFKSSLRKLCMLCSINDIEFLC